MKEVFAAFRSVPDYTAHGPTLHSVHDSLSSAIHALYPEDDVKFTRSQYVENTWNGPDGFGMVRKIEVQTLPPLEDFLIRVNSEFFPTGVAPMFQVQAATDKEAINIVKNSITITARMVRDEAP